MLGNGKASLGMLSPPSNGVPDHMTKSSPGHFSYLTETGRSEVPLPYKCHCSCNTVYVPKLFVSSAWKEDTAGGSSGEKSL